jgi:hypothetical protein
LIPLWSKEKELLDYLQGFREQAEEEFLAHINRLPPTAARYYRTHLTLDEPFEIYHLERRAMEDL